MRTSSAARPAAGIGRRPGRAIALSGPVLCGPVLCGAVLCGAALLALAGCGVPTQKADCDQLLHDRHFQQVVKSCDSPYDRASAYMGLAGFDLFAINDQVNAPGSGNVLSPAGIVAAMQLTPANITAKRRFMERAVFTVAQPGDAKQAFALLMASGMGMMMSALEYLDNGLGGAGAVAMDGKFTAGESEAAMGLAPTGASSSTVMAQPALYLSGVVAGTPYTFICADAVNPLDTSWCDGNPPGSLQVYADTDTVTGAGYGDGAGFQGALLGTVDLTPANPVSTVFQVTDIGLPFGLDPARVPAYQNFSGQGDAAQTFAIGIVGYLGHLHTAQAALAPAGVGFKNALSDAIDSFSGQLDNGAQCLGVLLGNPAIPASLNDIYPIYQAAIGTSARPMPASASPPGFFQAYNRIVGLNLAGLGINVSVAAAPYVFGQSPGTVTSLGTRFLYATQAGLGTFDPAVATPRIDRTPVAFQRAFEAMLVAPAVSSSRDNSISYAELLCVGAGAPPTGIAAAVVAAARQVTLTWNKISEATGYTVYRDTKPGVTQTTPNAVAFPSATPPFTDPNARPGNTYYYVVTSTNAEGEGGISREVTATP